MIELNEIMPVISAGDYFIRFVKWLAKRYYRARAKSTYIETLFGFLQDADFTTGRVPLDDIDSLKLFKSWLEDHFRRDREITYDLDLQTADWRKHLCTVGGPVDHPFSRYSMGYDRRGHNWQPILPFIFPLAEVEAKQRTITRKWKGRKWSAYNWYIADRDGHPRFIPEVDQNEILKKDYFMLTVAPNTFTERAFYNGQKHMMITPTHGLAQLAIKDVLDSDEILKQLHEIHSEYFQAIIEVPAKLKEDGYAPSGKFLVRAKEPLDLADFRKLVRFRDWL